jgi:hypothetical protein
MFYTVMLVLIASASVVAALLGYMIRRSFIRGRIGFQQASITDSGLKSHKCEYCSGGVQVLNDDGWGPFTPAQLSVSDASPFIESRSGNTRPCTKCLGKGFLWEDIPSVGGPLNARGYMTPNTGHIEHQRKLIRPYTKRLT